MNNLDEYDSNRLHGVRAVLEAVYNGIDSSFAENKHLYNALDSIEKAISVNPKKSVF